MYEVIVADRALAELKRLPGAVSGRLLDTLERLANWPHHGCAVRRLSGPL